MFALFALLGTSLAALGAVVGLGALMFGAAIGLALSPFVFVLELRRYRRQRRG